MEEKIKKAKKKKKLFPSSINLLGKEFKIFECDTPSTFNYRDKDGVVIAQTIPLGRIDLKAQKIWVDADLPKSSKYNILWHELGHYFSRYYSVSDNELFAECFSNYVCACINQLYSRKSKRKKARRKKK